MPQKRSMGGISTIRLPPAALEWVEFKQCTEGITSLQAKLCCLGSGESLDSVGFDR